MFSCGGNRKYDFKTSDEALKEYHNFFYRIMIGSIIGDIVGSINEFSNIKTKEFPLFSKYCEFTDGSILTVTTADWLLYGGDAAKYYSRYAATHDCPMGGYGSGFSLWVSRMLTDGDF